MFWLLTDLKTNIPAPKAENFHIFFRLCSIVVEVRSIDMEKLMGWVAKFLIFCTLLTFTIQCKSAATQGQLSSVDRDIRKINHGDPEEWVRDSFDFAHKQSLALIQKIGEDTDSIPRSSNPDGSLRLEKPVNEKGALGWTTGFFPGSLWYIYEYLNVYGKPDEAEEILRLAKLFTEKLAPVQNLTNDHDVGFVMYCSYGAGYRLTKDPQYKAVLLQTAASLKTRFNPKVGCTKSWDWWGNPQKDFPVIMDNMMNLELFYWASSVSQDSSYHDMANQHAATTSKNHFRPDSSAYHLVNYNPTTGAVQRQQNYQGYDDDSVWARGHAWALYGFTMSYRESKNAEFLSLAINLANYLYSHKNMPEDLVPYWDFKDPKIPNIARDASAAAIYASALYELSQYVSGTDSERFKKLADQTLRNLASDRYRETEIGKNNGFILKHSVGSLHEKLLFEIDVPLNYADYYFLEAMIRKLKLEGKI